MKYHLNNQHEVHECSADVQDCRFAGNSEDNNHFADYAEAEAEGQKRLQNEFPLIPQISRGKKHRPAVQKFVPLAKKGVHVAVESPMGRSHDRETSSITVLTGTQSTDSRLLARIRRGDAKAFAA